MPINLIIGDVKEATSADMPVRWCIDKATQQLIEDEGVENPQILLITYCKSTEMSRKIVAVSDLMTYIRFERPGGNRIIGFILRDNGEPVREVRKKFLKPHTSNNHQEMCWHGRYDCDHADVIEYSQHDVDIPANLFGTPPPKFINDYVNLWHENSVNDQCHFRRRALISIPKLVFVLPIAALLCFLSAFVYTFALLSGYKNLSQLPIIHPFEHPNPFSVLTVAEIGDMFTVTNRTSQSLHETKYLGSLYTLSPTTLIFVPLIIGIIIFLFNPLVEGILFIVAYNASLIIILASLMLVVVEAIYDILLASSKNKGSVYKFEKYLKTKWIIITSFAFAAFIFAPFIYLWTKFLNYSDEIDRKSYLNNYHDAKAMLCPNNIDNSLASISAIPKHKQSWKLKFFDFKTKVCKPMPK